MPRRSRSGKVKDKWHNKMWLTVEAPQSFGNTVVGYVPASDEKHAIGRVIETTLFDVVKQDPQQYVIKLYFQITKITNNIATSILKSSEYSREYLRSLVRRGSSTINLIKDYTTKDGITIRVNSLAFAQQRLNSSRKHSLRLLTDNVITEKTKNLTYSQFTQEAVLGKIATDIYDECKIIAHLRHVGIQKILIIKGEPQEYAEPITSKVDESLDESSKEGVISSESSSSDESLDESPKVDNIS